MAITPTIGGNITFGKGRLENKPIGSIYDDMLYFATDENTIFLGNTKVSSGLLDVEYKSVLSDTGDVIDLTNYPGLQATESGPIRTVGNNTILDKGSYILFKKMEYNGVQTKWEAKWHLIVLSSSVTPEALQTEINAIAGDVEQAQGDIEDLQNDVSVLDASLKETDQKVDNLAEKVDTVVIPDVSGLHEDVSVLQEYVADISQTVTDLCTNLAAVDNKVETLETILDTNSTTISTRLNNIEANYVKSVSAANASPIRVTTEPSTNGKDVTIDISLGTGLKIQDGSIGIDTTADIFNGLGSYKIVKVDEAGLQYKLQKAGADIADSDIINIPKDQFLKDVSIVDGTGANEGKKVIRFAWQLTDEKQPLHSEVLLTDIFPGIEGKTNEVSVTTNQTTGKLEVALDSSILNKIAELDSDLDSLDQQIYTYVGSTTDNMVVSVDSSTNDTKVISAHLQWINFDGE